MTCGDGRDTVYADADDTVAADCEKVRRGPAPELPGLPTAIAHLEETYPDSPDRGVLGPWSRATPRT